MDPDQVRGNSTLTYRQENLTFTYINVWWRYKYITNIFVEDMTERKITGFRVNWHICHTILCETDSWDRIDTVKWQQVEELPMYTGKNNAILLNKMVQLVINNKNTDIQHDKLWRTVLSQKIVNLKNLSMSWCKDKHDEHRHNSDELYGNLSMEDSVNDISNTDLILGTKLFIALNYCPDKIMELAKLAVFTDNLLDNHSARTIIQATINNMKPGVLEAKESLDGVKLFYLMLDNKYDFALGTILMALSSIAELRTMINLDLPYLTKHSQIVGECEKGRKCEEIIEILTKLGAVMYNT